MTLKLINEEWLDREIKKAAPKGWHEGSLPYLDALQKVKSQLKPIPKKTAITP